MPIFGLASMIHATVNRMPGITNGMISQREEQALERRVGALVHPGKQGAEEERERGGAGRKFHGIEKQLRSAGTQIGIAEILQRELRRRCRGLRRQNALPQQENQGHECEPNDCRHAQGDNYALEL